MRGLGLGLGLQKNKHAAEGGGGEYEGPLDLVPGAILAHSIAHALSSAKRGTSLYTIQRTSDGSTQAFSSDATTGLAPSASIAAFIGSASFTAAGDLSSGSNSVTVDTTGVVIGQKVSGNGIPSNTFVVSVGEGTITVSKAATDNLTGETLTFLQQGKLTEVVDQSANSEDLAPVDDGPTLWVPNVQSAHPGILQFATMTSFLETPGLFSSGGGMTAFLVSAGGGQFLPDSGPNGYFDFAIRANGTGFTDLYDGDNEAGGDLSWTPDNNFHVFELSVEQGSNEFLIDGVAQTTDTSADFGEGPIGSIGFSNTQALLGSTSSERTLPMCTLIVWPLLNNTQREQIRENLAAFFEITLS